jgi:hypothetical protein
VKILWAYAYQIVPPQPSRGLGPIRALLKDETDAAHGGPRTWSGRLVLERRATHILIVSEDVGRNHDINRALEDELGRLNAVYTVTEPLSVADDAAGVKWMASFNGNGH